MSATFRERGLQWPLFIVGLLGASVLAHVYFVYASVSDPSVVVERDYYKKAVGWDALRTQDERNATLGWTLEVKLVRVEAGAEVIATIRDRTQAILTGATLTVEAFHKARAAERLEATLEPRGESYVARLPMQRPGLWELRFVATRGNERFTAVRTPELFEGGEPAREAPHGHPSSQQGLPVDRASTP